MNAIISAHKSVPKHEKVGAIADQCYGTQAPIFILRRIKNVINRVYLIPVVIHHEMEFGEFALLCTVEG